MGLALVTLGNIASVDMSRDLFPEVEELLVSQNTYTRRKAALCAMRICRKVPELREGFLEKAKGLLHDRNHGVLLCGLTLITSLCEADDNDEQSDDEESLRAIEMFRPIIPHLVKLLNDLTTSTYVSEYDVSGIADPFLQTNILKLLRVLGRGDRDSSEQMMDILAKVGSHHKVLLYRYITNSCADYYHHRSLEERRYRRSLRSRLDHPRHRSRFLAPRLGREHPRQIPVG